MSNQSSAQKAEGQRTNHLQLESIPYSIQTSHELARFTAAITNGYHAKPQTKASDTSSGSHFTITDSSYQATLKKPMAQFATSTYASAEQRANGLRQPPLPQVDLNTFKGIKFVTLDPLQDQTRDVYDDISGTWHWEHFTNQHDRCIKYIRDECANKQVFLISSGEMGRKVVRIIHDLPQVYAIYIHCMNVPSNREWSNKYSKVRVVCNDDDRDLIPQFAVDVAQANIEWGDALLKQGQRDKAKAKYEKASTNLTKYAKMPDPTMIKTVQTKLDQCK